MSSDLDLATIGVAFDTTGLKEGQKALGDAAKAGDAAADSTQRVTNAAKDMGREWETAAKRSQRQLQALTEEVERLKSANERLQREQGKATGGVGAAADEMHRLTGGLSGGIRGISGMTVAIGGLSAAAGVLISLRLAGAINDIITPSIESAAKMHDLSIATGVAVERLSALSAAGVTTNTSVEQIALMTNRLSRALSKTNDESHGVGRALAAVGISVKEFQDLSPDEKMIRYAKALNQYKDGSEKSANAQDALGRGAAMYLPFLKDLAEAGELAARVTTDQAAAADDYTDNLTLLRRSSEAWKRELAMGMVPALADASKGLLDVFNGAGGLRAMIHGLAEDGSIERWTRSAISGASYLLDVFDGLTRVARMLWNSLDILFTGVRTGEKIAVAALAGGFTEEGQSYIKREMAGWNTFIAGLKASNDSALNDALAGQRIRDAMTNGAKPEKTDRQDLNYNTAKEGKDRQADAYRSLMEAIRSKDAAALEELETERKLTEADKLYIQLDKLVAEGKIRERDAYSDATVEMVENLRIHLEEIEARKKSVKINQELYREQEQFRAEVEKGLADEQKQREAGTRAVSEYSRSITESNNAAKYQLDIMGLTGKERAIALADYKTEIELKKQLDAINSNLAYDESQREIERNRVREAADLEKQTNRMNAEMAETNRIIDSIDGTAKSVWTNVMQGGQDAFSKIAATIKATVLDMLYQMTIRKWVISIAANVSGGASASSANGGGVMGLYNTGSSLYNAYNAGASLYGVGSQYFAGTMSGANAAGTLYANAAGGGIDSLLAFSNAYGTGSGAGYGAASFFGAGEAGAAGAAGSGAAGAGGAMAAAGPFATIVAAYLAMNSIIKWSEDGRRNGGGYTMGANGAVSLTSGTDLGAYGSPTDVYDPDTGAYRHTLAAVRPLLGGQLANDAVTAATQGFADSIKMMLKTFGSTATLQEFYGGLASSNTNDSVIYAGGKINGKVFGRNQDDAASNLRSNLSDAEAVAAYQRQLGVSLIQALDAADLGGQIDAWIKKLGDIDSLTAEAVASAVQNVSAYQSIVAAAKNLPDPSALASIGVEATAALVKVFGTAENLINSIGSYQQNYLTDAERAIALQGQVSEALAKVNLKLPTTRDDFRALVEAQDLNTDAGRAAYLALMNVQAAFASLVPAAGSAAASVTRSVEEIANEHEGLQTRLDELLGNTAALRERELAKLDASNRALQQQIWALEDQKKAADDAKAALDKAIATQRSSLQQSLSASKAIYDTLHSSIASLYGSVSSTAGMAAGRGRDLISAAIESGKLPSQSDLSDAISAVTNAVASKAYASLAQEQIAKLALAGELSKLKDRAGQQVSFDQMQLDALDETASRMQELVDSTNGVNDSVLTVEQAVKNLMYALVPSSKGGDKNTAQKQAGGPIVDAAAASFGPVGTAVSGYTYNPDDFGGLSADQYKKGVLGLLGIKGYADGGMHAGGMRLVGERGPELEVTGPARYYDTKTTAQLFGQQSNVDFSPVVTELRYLRSAIEQVVIHTSRLDRRIDRIVRPGDSGVEAINVRTVA